MDNATKYFVCESCQYRCLHKGDWNKHINTKKHKMLDYTKKTYKCNCGKVYAFKSGLSKHKKKCLFIQGKETDNKDIQSLQEWKVNHPDWQNNDVLLDEYIQLTQKVAINLH